MDHSLFIFTLFVLISAGYCSKCTNPQVTSKSFTTQDATIVANIAYISEFTVKCGSGAINNLYAEVNGVISPVSVVGNNVYQVSWTESIKSAKSGDFTIRLFDEDGYTALRKALRSDEDISAVPELFSVSVSHPGAYNGPWLKSEFVATALSFFVAYLALTARSKFSS